MSKQTNDKLVGYIKSADKKIETITAGKESAKSRLARADQEIRETRAQRQGYVAMLEARGLDENGDTLTDEAEPEGGPQFN